MSHADVRPVNLIDIHYAAKRARSHWPPTGTGVTVFGNWRRRNDLPPRPPAGVRAGRGGDGHLLYRAGGDSATTQPATMAAPIPLLTSAVIERSLRGAVGPDYMIPQTFTVTSNICFYFLVFLFYNF